jgi:hypothetical protein
MGVHRQTVLDWIERGVMEQVARSPSGRFLIPVESLTRFFERLYSGQPMPPSARRYLKRIARP